MNRIVSAVALFVLFATAVAVLLAYLAYGVRSRPDSAVSMPSVSETVRIDRSKGGAVRVSAESFHDALVGVGFAAGLERTWQISLLQRAALGRLSEWQGERMLEVDEFTRAMGIGREARASYEQLDEETRGLLDAYSSGLAVALADRNVQRNRYVLLHESKAIPWAPWHTIAVERLMAWLSTDPGFLFPSDLTDADQSLRRLLSIHGLRNSLSLASGEGDTAGLYARYVMGSSVLPFPMELEIRVNGRSAAGLTWPGTPYLVAGHGAESAWTVVPASGVEISDTLTGPTEAFFERIELRDGSERILEGHRAGHALVRPGSTDSTNTHVRWSGMSHRTDATDWLQVIRMALNAEDISATDYAFGLLDARLVVVAKAGELSAPSDALPVSASARLLSSSPYVGPLVSRLDTLQAASAGFDPGSWFSDTRSPWGAELATLIVAAVDSLEASDRLPVDVLSYLRNWNGDFSPATIAGSVVDRVAGTCRDLNVLPGAAPDVPPRQPGNHRVAAQPAEPDSAAFEAEGVVRCLRTALAQLRAQYGNDPSRWRWERIATASLRVPGSSVWHEPEHRDAAWARPVAPAVAGHPTALSWGPSAHFEGGLPSPVAWEAWIVAPEWRWNTRRIRLDIDRPLGRQLPLPAQRTTAESSAWTEGFTIELRPAD